MVKPGSMLIEQQLMPPLDPKRPAQDPQIGVSPQTFALTLAKSEPVEPDAQQHHPAGFAAPFPKIPSKNNIRPITPPILAKPVEHHWMQGLHREILLDVVRVERDIAEYG